MRLAAAGIFCIVAFLLVHPKLLDGSHFLGWDALRHAWGNIEFLRRSIASGELPLWCPWEKGGFSFSADPESGAFYPIVWVLAALSQLLGPGAWIMLVNALVHLLIAGVGIFLYLRRWGLHEGAALVGGLSYTLSSRLAKSKDQTALGPSVWLPWLLMAIEETVRRPSWRSGALLGTAVGCNVLAGYPPNVFRNLLAVALFFAFELCRRLRASEHAWDYLQRLSGALLLAVLLAVALASPVVAPLSLIKDSARESMTLYEILHSTIGIEDAWQLLAPGVRDQPDFLLYQGLLPALLALFALLRFSPQRLLWAFGAVFFFLLACGDGALLLPALVAKVPGFALFRVPELYLFGAVFFVAVLAASGLSELLGANQRRRVSARRQILLVTLLALAVQLAVRYLGAPSQRPAPYLPPSAVLSLYLLPPSAAVLWGLVAESRHLQLLARVLLVPLLLLDLGLQNRPTYDILAPKPSFAADQAALAPLQQPAADIRSDVRIADHGQFGYRLGMRERVREFFGRQTALISERYRRYVAHALAEPRLLAAANVRYEAFALRRAPQAWVRTLSDAAPFAYWVGRPTLARSGAEALALLARRPAGSLGILERPDLDAQTLKELAALRSETPPVPARLLHLGNNRVRLALDTPAAGLLVINEVFAPGWRATVDGQPVRIYRTNYIFRGLRVSGGLHEIELWYRPAAVVFSIGLYAATVVALLVALAVVLGRRRRRKRALTNPPADRHQATQS